MLNTPKVVLKFLLSHLHPCCICSISSTCQLLNEIMKSNLLIIQILNNDTNYAPNLKFQIQKKKIYIQAKKEALLIFIYSIEKIQKKKNIDFGRSERNNPS